MKLTILFKEFFNSEKAGGIVLLAATITSLAFANSHWQFDYADVWAFKVGGHSFVEWINDGLMAIFFLMIGLELEREIYHGELSDIRSATFPLFAAIGGMVIPATIYLMLNWGSETQPGAGIPMATDIAFAIGALSLLGKRVPAALKIFLIALAVIDDLGAIVVITIFYSKTITAAFFFLAMGIWGILMILNKLKVSYLSVYLLGGVFMWICMSKSGVHATITGVMLAFAIPFNSAIINSPSYRLQHFLHKPVAFIILPLFALANTSITINDGWENSLLQVGSLGIILGLVVGKPLGILTFSYLSVKLGACKKPIDIQWGSILGVGVLGGIGFTMSIFISFLAYDRMELTNISKIAILSASAISGVLGILILRYFLKKKMVDEDADGVDLDMLIQEKNGRK